MFAGKLCRQLKNILMMEPSEQPENHIGSKDWKTRVRLCCLFVKTSHNFTFHTVRVFLFLMHYFSSAQSKAARCIMGNRAARGKRWSMFFFFFFFWPCVRLLQLFRTDAHPPWHVAGRCGSGSLCEGGVSSERWKEWRKGRGGEGGKWAPVWFSGCPAVTLKGSWITETSSPKSHGSIWKSSNQSVSAWPDQLATFTEKEAGATARVL